MDNIQESVGGLSYLYKLHQRITEWKVDIEHPVVFGVGSVARQYLDRGCFEAEIRPSFFADNSVKSQGGTFGGISIISPNDIDKDSLVLVGVEDKKMRVEIEAQLQELEIKFCGIFEFVLSNHIKELEQVLRLLDPKSRDIYMEVIFNRIKGEYNANFCYHQYFVMPQFMIANAKEVFVDCGGFVGDTSEAYICEHGGSFGKIFCIEPYKPSFDAINIRFRRLEDEWAFHPGQLNAILGAVGEKHGQLFLGISDNENNSAGAIVNSVGHGIPTVVYTLDELFADQTITFLKADVEGKELDMLRGADKVIHRDLPKMTISLYHRPMDFYEIPLYINGLNLGYHFAIRQHSPFEVETVLYAWKE